MMGYALFVISQMLQICIRAIQREARDGAVGLKWDEQHQQKGEITTKHGRYVSCKARRLCNRLLSLWFHQHGLVLGGEDRAAWAAV